jgi:phosphotransferase system enzyme I (PtsI)
MGKTERRQSAMKTSPSRQVLQGIGITQEKASAPLFFHMPSHSLAAPLPVLRTRAEEETRLRDAVAAVRTDLSRLQERATAEAGSSAAQIFDIHAMLLEDEDLWEALQAALDEGHPAERAVELAVEKFSVLLQALEDDYLSERCRDLADLANQIREKLGGGATPQKNAPEAPYILVAEDLSPSETVRLDKSRIAGFVTFLGSASSHTAILARAMGIPALVGVGRISLPRPLGLS